MGLKCTDCGIVLDDVSYVCPCKEGRHPRPGCQECYEFERYLTSVEKSKEIAERNHKYIWGRHAEMVAILREDGILGSVLDRMSTPTGRSDQ